METKRCQRCHKLLRADAPVCNRCGGLDFLQVTQARSGRTGATKEPPSIPSNPPASPHRAGHYSGLHPEDQPYQSSFLNFKMQIRPRESGDERFRRANDLHRSLPRLSLHQSAVSHLSPHPLNQGRSAAYKPMDKSFTLPRYDSMKLSLNRMSSINWVKRTTPIVPRSLPLPPSHYRLRS